MIEARNTNDIVIEDFQDTYLNLTLKSTFMLKWLLDQCSSAKFVMKVDDDMFVNPANLWATIQATELNSIQLNENSNNLNYALIGREVTEVIPVRTNGSKWYLPRSLYPPDTFPPYLSGPSYILTGSLLQPIYSCALR